MDGSLRKPALGSFNHSNPILSPYGFSFAPSSGKKAGSLSGNFRSWLIKPYKTARMSLSLVDRYKQKPTAVDGPSAPQAAKQCGAQRW